MIYCIISTTAVIKGRVYITIFCIFSVLGISNLKVVDASVMPSVPNTNIAAPTIMIAEKVADEILQSCAAEE